MLADLLFQTGLPEGILNVIIGGGEVGSFLIDQPIDLVWFTGSTKVGQEIYAKCGRKFVKSLLEMGGSSPAVVFSDADKFALRLKDYLSKEKFIKKRFNFLLRD